MSGVDRHLVVAGKFSRIKNLLPAVTSAFIFVFKSPFYCTYDLFYSSFKTVEYLV